MSKPRKPTRSEGARVCLTALKAAVASGQTQSEMLQQELLRLAERLRAEEVGTADRAKRLAAVQNQLQEIASSTDTIERIGADLSSLADIQSALLRWGIGISRGMREEQGAVATLQMAELDRLRGRSESIKQNYDEVDEGKGLSSR